MDGILNINKPQGKTSFDIVALVRRLSGERHVGHAGTLDPMATGVLPVCLGQGTRIVEFLMAGKKCYQARIELGVTTDTYDADGEITQEKDPSGITLEQLELALTPFRGAITQLPPQYSAVKYQGKPLYKYARSGIRVELQHRPVSVYRLDLTDFKPPIVTIEVECGRGTYIRSIAHDLGQTLGCGASLKSLIRLRCGPFDIRDAVSVPQLAAACRYGYWPRLVYPIDMAITHWAAIVVNDDMRRTIKNGGPLSLGTESALSAEERCRAYTPEGSFLGVLHFDPESREWQPEKVFAGSYDGLLGGNMKP